MLYLVWLYAIMMFVDIGLLLAQLYFIIIFSDLESDYINPMELCESMDFALPIEAAIQAVGTAVLLFSGQIGSFVLCLPVTAYNAFQYKETRLKFDATTIFKTVRRYRIESIVKLVFYFFMFCYFLYSMIWALVAWSDAA